MIKPNMIHLGDCLEVMKQIEDNSIDMIMTSPPYWGLRAYGTNYQIFGGDSKCQHVWEKHIRKPAGGKGSDSANVGANRNDEANLRNGDTVTEYCSKCGAWKGELGLEPNYNEYILHLCDIFDEAKRILKPTGTCFVNIGDTYGGSGKGANGDKPNHAKESWNFKKTPKLGGVSKSLCQIPSRFAIEMCNRGWILRNEIIWYKKNAMPTSANDRFTVDFEKIFFFVKNKKYYFNQQFEPHTTINDLERKIRNNKSELKTQKASDTYSVSGTGRNRTELYGKNGRNKRTVWQINTRPLKEAHFATFPEELCKTPILSGCPENGIVLDMFMGAGTTGLVARKLNRNYIGIELNTDYIKIAEKRISAFEEEKRLWLV